MIPANKLIFPVRILMTLSQAHPAVWELFLFGSYAEVLKNNRDSYNDVDLAMIADEDESLVKQVKSLTASFDIDMDIKIIDRTNPHPPEWVRTIYNGKDDRGQTYVGRNFFEGYICLYHRQAPEREEVIRDEMPTVQSYIKAQG